jgi:predicted DNA-binding transcriptional regulator AlpA
MKTQWVPDRIDPTLTCDGFAFRDHNARGRYIRTVVANRPQYAKDNPDKCISIEAFREIAARRRNSGKVVATVRPNASLSNRDAHNSVNGVSECAAEPPVNFSLAADRSMAASETPTTMAPSLSKIGESGFVLNGRTYLTTQQFALMLGVSKRTLYRLLEDGKRPPQVKFPGIYYERDAILKWAADQGLAIKQTRNGSNDDA